MKILIIALIALICFSACTKVNEPSCETWLVQAGFSTNGMFCNHINKPLTEYTFCFSSKPDSTKFGAQRDGSIYITRRTMDTLFYVYIISKK